MIKITISLLSEYQNYSAHIVVLFKTKPTLIPKQGADQEETGGGTNNGNNGTNGGGGRGRYKEWQ